METILAEDRSDVVVRNLTTCLQQPNLDIVYITHHLISYPLIEDMKYRFPD
jgi:hypothetical protein